jgi:hypothetical protein
MFTRKQAADFLRILRFKLHRGMISREDFNDHRIAANRCVEIGVTGRLDFAMSSLKKMRKSA